jgi:hypothetical protein
MGSGVFYSILTRDIISGAVSEESVILPTTRNFPKCTPVRYLHTTFNLPYIYDYITKLCRQQAEVIQNHENEHVLAIGQCEARHRKCRRLKLGGGIHAMFQGIREIKKGFQPRTTYRKDKDGLMIGEEGRSWRDGLLNAEYLNPDALDQVVDGAECCSGARTCGGGDKEEVKKAATFMRNNSASGEDAPINPVINPKPVYSHSTYVTVLF